MLRHRQFLGCFATAVTLLLMACTPPIDQRGNEPDPIILAEITPGVHDQDQVAELLGTPSSIGTFDGSVWYYISKRTEQFAFFEPDVLDQQVVAISFDQDGIVREIRWYSHADGAEVELVEDETPTRGKELTFARQMMNSMGFLNRDPLRSEPIYSDDGHQ